MGPFFVSSWCVNLIRVFLYDDTYIIRQSACLVLNPITVYSYGFLFKVVRDPCQKITLLLLKSKSVRVIVPESCF